MEGPRFIALEGIDGSGTTTQCAAVAAWLAQRGHRVHTTREPSAGPAGRLVRAHLATDARRMDPAAMALLFAADRIDHLEQEIAPALARGEVVLSDRYLLSSLAYQSLELPLTWVLSINDRAPRPDLHLLLDLPAADAVARVAARNVSAALPEEIFDAPRTQTQLAARYRELGRRDDLGPVAIIDAGAPPAEVTAQLVAELARRGL